MMSGVGCPLTGIVVGHHIEPVHRLEEQVLANPANGSGISRSGHGQQPRPPAPECQGVEFLTKSADQAFEAYYLSLIVRVLPVEIDTIIIRRPNDLEDSADIFLERLLLRHDLGELAIPPPAAERDQDLHARL